MGNHLFRSVEQTKSTDLYKCKYSGYGKRVDSRSEISFTDGIAGKNVMFFGADMNSSVDIDNKNKIILIHGERPTQWLDDTTLIAEAKYPIDFTQSRKRFILTLNYNGSNSLLFVNAIKMYQFKAKGPKIKDYTLCLGNISKDFTINNMKKVRLKGSVNFFWLILILLILMIFLIYRNI